MYELKNFSTNYNYKTIKPIGYKLNNLSTHNMWYFFLKKHSP